MLIGMLALTGCGQPASEQPAARETRALPAPATPGTPGTAQTPSPDVTPLARGGEPVRVAIPSIEIEAPLIDLGIGDAGVMEVPADYDDVGWFTGGGRPGGYGPTVIAAHVDSPTGPAAFIRLRELAPGDEVEVTDETGVAHRYTVTEVADYPKADFPTARVFGATATDELRLITCGGVFDPAAASYEDNRVVFAERSG
ncbi:class F sortase [uncultured Microbacterium sp.]|uniref:class F sortase n=2 Tax=Microbacterium TaxID=33882 RepID=UPI0025994639|nr:class F sortase [uncultured Microbacterium sp.]